MTSQQGDLALLQEPVAQQLLQSTSPARLAYVWTDGTPRVVPINFHWNGTELVFGGPPDAPKMRALQDGDQVAASIDTDAMPYRVLQIRGRIRTDTVDGVAPEYEALTRRVMGDEAGEAWLVNLRAMTSQMSRVFLRPEWVALLDFETRFPSALERAMERAAR
jgi:Pyridoxamine 5'-phosphate oxidase